MFRRAVMTFTPKRGGGHAHPDFPFLGYYKHKRIISPTETNLWVYDGMAPEYVVDILAPQYTLGHILSRNFFFAWFLPFFIGSILTVVVYRNFKRHYFTTTVKNDRNELRKYLLRVKNENSFKDLKHPLRHMHTYLDEGWVQGMHPYVAGKFSI